MEDDLQYLILTPNSVILGREAAALTEYPDNEDNWKRGQRYVAKCKDVTWKRWKRKYLTNLREQHNMTLKLKESKINVVDVVMIKENDKTQGTCEMRIKSGKCIEEKIK